MIKIVISGIWVCAVTLGASYAAVSWETRNATTAAADKGHGGVETLRTRMISVPIIREGTIQGYAMAQFIVTGQAKVFKTLAVKPDLIILDEAFKAMYGDETVDFRQLKKQDLTALTKRIVDNTNKRMGQKVIDDAMIQELNYIPKDRVRAGAKNGT